MGNNMIRGIVFLFDIKDEKVYVRLTDSVIRKIGLNFNKTSFDKKFLYRLKEYKRTSLGSLRKISKELRFSQRFIEENVISISSDKSTSIGIKAPKLPFNFRSGHGARIISGVYGDGGITENGTVAYFNKSRKLVNLFIVSMKAVFGDIDFKLRLRKDGTYSLSFPKMSALVFSLLGMPWGPKTRTDPKIPDFIFGLEKKFKADFIRQYADDEGNVRLKDRRLQMKQTIEAEAKKEELKSDVKKYAPRCLMGLRKMLLDLNIVSKISLSCYRVKNGKKSADWEISVYGKESLENFKTLVGFNLDYKTELLKKCLTNYKHPSAGRNERLLYALQYTARIEKRDGYIDKHKLTNETGRALWKTCTYFLVDLKKEGLIKTIEKPRNKSGYPLAWKYTITDEGWKYLKNRKDRIILEDVRKRF